MIEKIISGGQTGADQGALAAAKYLGLATGGWAPKGFLTEAGPNHDLSSVYKLMEHSSYRYPHRTQNNVLMSDATFIFGKPSSGSNLTKQYAQNYGKPCFTFFWTATLTYDFAQVPYQPFISWLNTQDIKVLNVAGNRESQNPGIVFAVRYFLIVNLRHHLRQAKALFGETAA